MTADQVEVAAALERSESALRAAQVLAKEGLFDDAFSRLYYAVFHAVTALLLSQGLEPKRHRALPGLLGRHFAQQFDAEEIALIARAATHRDLADYERSWHATQALFDRSLQELLPLLAKLEQLAKAG